MTDRIQLLEEMLTEAHRLIGGVSPDQLTKPTPCADFDVAALLDHMTTWITVFDRTANQERLDFDPEHFHLESGWAEHFAKAAEGVISGLRSGGVERPMVMTADPIPGFIVLDMLSMEYIGHGIDLARATGQHNSFTDEQARLALEASQRLIQPEYRGTGPDQFHPIVETAADADNIDRFVAFLGRDPKWGVSV
jgi:uncharacterized protein (TIGR03086 family)